MTDNFFSSYDLNPHQAPKIKVWEQYGEMHASWDQDDPELIAAGINDLTPEEWVEVMRRVQIMAENQPVLEKRADGTSWWYPADGSEPYQIKPKPRQ